VIALAVGATTAIAVADSFDGAATAGLRATRVDPPHPSPALVLGDSALAALSWVPRSAEAVAGFPRTIDVEACRRLVAASCPGRGGRPPLTAYQALAAHGTGFETLVVAVGYNDGATGIVSAFPQIVARARQLGYTRIVWFTLRSDPAHVASGYAGTHRSFATSNAHLRDLLANGDYSDVVLADWGAYTAYKSQWFVNDGVHFKAIGAWAAADYITRKIAFLDGRVCPMAVAPSADPELPCPDPDVTGPVADLDALYPV
jgi:hypothetical protein